MLSVLLVPAVIAGPPPTDWRWLLPSEVVAFNPFYPEEFDVAHGNGTFVGVGGYGAVATSPDGLAWTVNLPGTFDYYASVAFGGGIFVAGGGGVISTSADGVHWEHHSQTGIGDYVELRRIRYLGGQFVAIGWEYLIDGYIGGVLYTSPNGQHWTERLHLLPPSGHDVYLAGIAYGNGRFVVVGSQVETFSNSNTSVGLIYTSVNGAQWTQGNPTPSLSGDGHIAFGLGSFVLVEGRRILTSADGVSWQPRHELENTWFWRGIAVSGGRTVCLAEQYSDNDQIRPGLAVSSEDGVSWQASPMPANVSRQLFSDGDTFFAIGARSALSSPDGIAWTEQFTPAPLDPGTPSLWRVVYGDQGFVAVGDQGTILASRDGDSWVTRESGTPYYLNHVTHGAGRYVAAGGNGALVHSTDGETWTPADLGGVTLSLGPLGHGADRFVLLTSSRNNGFFWTSEDGIAWQLRFADALSAFDSFSSVAFGNGHFVASGYGGAGFGYSGAVALSEDGITWQRVILPDPYRDASIRTVIFDGHQFLARSYPYGLFASPDGQTWTVIDDTPYLFAIGYGDGNFVAVRGASENPWGDVIALLGTSTDGFSWTTAAPFRFGNGSLNFAYGAGRFVGVGGNFDGTARLLISGAQPRLRPLLELRGDATQLTLRIRGTIGEIWQLQQSVDMLDWQTIRSVTLESESQEIEVAPLPGGQGFWRLSSP